MATYEVMDRDQKTANGKAALSQLVAVWSPKILNLQNRVELDGSQMEDATRLKLTFAILTKFLGVHGFGYPNPVLAESLYAKSLCTLQTTVEESEVVAHAGQDGAIGNFFTFINKLEADTAKILITAGSFGMFEHSADNNNVDLQKLPRTSAYNTDVQEMLSVLNSKRSLKAIVVVTPDNPTGRTIDKGDLLTLVEKCKEQGVYLYVDLAYDSFADKPLRPELVKLTKDNPYLVLGCSASKDFAIYNERIGFSVANEVTASELRSRRDPYPIGRASVMRLKRALDKQYKHNYHSKRYEKVKENRRRFVGAIDALRGNDKLKLKVIGKPQGNFVLLEVTGTETQKFMDHYKGSDSKERESSPSTERDQTKRMIASGNAIEGASYLRVSIDSSKGLARIKLNQLKSTFRSMSGRTPITL